MAWSDIFIGAGKGGLTGASSGAMIGSCFPPYGTIVGGIAGFIVGAVAGGVEGNYEGDEKDKMVENQKKSAAETNRINQMNARRQTLAAHESAMGTNASSDQLFTKAALKREADTNYASVRDKGKPFSSANEKSEKQFYGNSRAVV